MPAIQITVHGKPDLIKGLSKMFEKADGGTNFEGLCIGGMCSATPKDEIVNIPCQIRIRCVESKKSFKTSGFVSPSFVNEATLPNAKVTIANKRMSRRKKAGYHKYIISIN